MDATQARANRSAKEWFCKCARLVRRENDTRSRHAVRQRSFSTRFEVMRPFCRLGLQPPGDFAPGSICFERISFQSL
jgi:hypothetical protein